MSVERAREFLEAVVADPALQARLDSAGNRQATLEVMGAAGYGDVTQEDLNAVVAAGAGTPGELTDAELEGAAGGSFVASKVIPFIYKAGSWIAGKLD
jgi:predicted ribosomally synthesized peptide with nif11-like leader